MLTLVSRDLQKIMSLPLQHKIRDDSAHAQRQNMRPIHFPLLGMTKADTVYHTLNPFLFMHARSAFAKLGFIFSAVGDIQN